MNTISLSEVLKLVYVASALVFVPVLTLVARWPMPSVILGALIMGLGVTAVAAVALVAGKLVLATTRLLKR